MTSYLVEYTLANGSSDAATFTTPIYCNNEGEAIRIWEQEYNSRGEYRILRVRIGR